MSKMSTEFPPRSAAAAASEFDGRVRIVPIMLPDGTMLRRDPDESVEVKTEFTNYCHQEYADGEEGGANAKDDAAIIQSLLQKKAKAKDRGQKGDGAERPPAANGIGASAAPPPTATGSAGCGAERVVPITLSNGDEFMPTFTRLDDLEPPDWSAAFGGPSRKNDENARVSSSGRDGQKETVVPIHVDGGQNRAGRSTQRNHEQSGTSTSKEEKDESNWAKRSSDIGDGGCGGETVFGGKSETREREEGVETTRTKKTLTTTDKTTKRSEQKKVQGRVLHQ